MNLNGREALKWAIAVPFALCASSFLALLGTEISILLDRPFVSAASMWFPQMLPSIPLSFLNRMVGLGLLLLWVVPPALLVGSLLHARWAIRWYWIVFVVLTLFAAASAWIAHAGGDRLSLAAAMAIGCILAVAIWAHLGNRKSNSFSLWALGIAGATIFIPPGTRLVRADHLPPVPHKLWSVVLQKGTWQAMNTGSEYDATRQIAFAGDRIVVVYDAGQNGYTGKWPTSRYQVTSLNRVSGAVLNKLDFTGRWGDLPHVFGATDGTVILQGSSHSQLLNADLTASANQGATVEGQLKKVSFQSDCGSPHFLTGNRVLIAGCGSVQLLTSEGKVLVKRVNDENAYEFGGVSANGTRFALQARDERGDPSFLIDERFYVYDSATLKPLATIPVTDLPERQSWTAFSPDGRYFAVGNPNELTLFEVP